MITSFEDLEAHTRLAASLHPQEAAETILVGPGIAPHERLFLQTQIKGLPESYLTCAERFNLHGIRSGYFALWPEAFEAGDLVKSLITANSDTNPLRPRFAQLKVVQVASWEAEPVVVSLDGAGDSEAVVYKVSVGNPDHPLSPLAPDFCRFMLLVGNLDQVALESEGRNALDDFKRCFEKLALDKGYWTAWKKIAEVVLFP